MKNRKLILILSLVLALTMSLGGTLAYLTDTDADVNTMVLGNVQIVQNEQQWNDDKSELEEFEQDKPLLPYVGTLGWENKEDQNGAYRRFTMNNVVDKYVTVTNKGNTNAYVRTIIALEMGDYTYDEFKMIGVSNNAENGSEFKFPGAWVWTDDYAAEIDGHNYNIMVAVHQKPLAAKETTIPSLLQVYLSKDADNEDVQRLDGNKNGKYDILVISQAVQADGFGSAAEALEAGFGKVTANERETVASWFASIGDPDSDYQIGSPNTDPETGKNDTNNPPYAPVTSVEELLNADGPITAEVPLKLEKDESVTKPIQVGNEGKLELDLADNSLNNDDGRVFENNGGEAVLSNGTMDGGSATEYAHTTVGADAETVYNEVNITSAGGGVGAANGAQVTFNSGSVEVDSKSTSGRYLFYAEGEGSVITINGGSFDFNKTQNQKRAYIYAGAGTTVYVNGGTFGKASTRSGYTAGILGEGTVIITGGTFGFNPSAWVADGYVATQNDSTWTVAAE